MNELATIKPEQWPILNSETAEQMRETMECNMEDGGINPNDLPHIRIPSGGAEKWSFEDPVTGETIVCDAIEGILVAVGKQIVLWPYEMDESGGSGSAPYITSTDLRNGYITGNDSGDLDLIKIADVQDPKTGVVDMNRLHYNQWGTGRHEAGKRCKESRTLYILRKGDRWPVAVVIPATSLRNIVRKMLPFLTGRMYRCVVSLKLKKERNKAGFEYSVIHGHQIGELADEQGEIINQIYRKPLLQAQKDLDALMVRGGQPASQ